MDNISRNVSQPEIASGETIRQFLVIETENVK